MKKILFSLMAVVLVIGLMGSAFAYFTDVETSTGNVMEAGTLDLTISNDNSSFYNTPVSATFNSPTGLAPGQEFVTGPVYLHNAGTMNIRWIWARFCNLVEANGTETDAELSDTPARDDISKYIELVSVFESNGGAYTEYTFDNITANAFLGYWNTRGASFTLDGSISLNNLVAARNYGSGDHVTSLVLLNAAPFPNPALPAGATAAFKFKFKLLDTTPNAYQGDTATFEVDFIGSHRDVYPDDLLNDYITETLGP